MSVFTETTAAILRALRESKDMNQSDVAEILGITQTAVSKIEGGIRTLSTAEQAILDWHFFGVMPPRLSRPEELRGVLEFSEAEWAVIGILAKRVGQTHHQWIRAAILNIIHGSGLLSPPLHSLPEPEEATTPPAVKVGNTGA